MHEDKATCRKVTDEIMQAIAKLSGQEYVDEYQYNPEVAGHSKPADAKAPKAPGA
jgi:hypothetical protein